MKIEGTQVRMSSKTLFKYFRITIARATQSQRNLYLNVVEELIADDMLYISTYKTWTTIIIKIYHAIPGTIKENKIISTVNKGNTFSRSLGGI